jgi:hypothetical protein
MDFQRGVKLVMMGDAIAAAATSSPLNAAVLVRETSGFNVDRKYSRNCHHGCHTMELQNRQSYSLFWISSCGFPFLCKFPDKNLSAVVGK